MERSPATQVELSRGLRGSALIALSLLTLLAIGLRLHAAEFGLPHKPTTDEEVYAGQLERLKGEVTTTENDPNLGVYPQLVSRIALLLSRSEGDPPPARTLAQHLERASHDLLLLRRIVACLSILIVPGTWLLARKFLDPPASFLAAGLAAFSLLHLQLSQEARPHGVAAGFAVLAMVSSIEIRRTGKARFYWLAGSAIGLATGALASGLAGLLPLTGAHLLRPKPRKAREHFFLLGAFSIVAICLYLFYPLLLAAKAGSAGAPDSPAGPAQNYLPFVSVEGSMSVLHNRGFAELLSGMWNFDPWILLLVGLGLGMWIAGLAGTDRGDSPRSSAEVASRRKDVLVVLAQVLPYLLIFGLSSLTRARYAIPLLAPATCLAAWGVHRIGSLALAHARTDRSSALLRFAPASLVLIPQAVGAIHLSLLCGRDDPTEQAATWIGENLSPGVDRIAAVPSLILPLFYDRESLPSDPSHPHHPLSLWIPYQVRTQPALGGAPAWRIRLMKLLAPDERSQILGDVSRYLRELHADYVAVELYDRPVLRELLAGLHAHASRVARFGPTGRDDGDDRPLIWFGAPEERVGVPCWAWRMMQMRSLGAVVEIYKLDRS